MTLESSLPSEGELNYLHRSINNLYIWLFLLSRHGAYVLRELGELKHASDIDRQARALWYLDALIKFSQLKTVKRNGKPQVYIFIVNVVDVCFLFLCLISSNS